MTLNFETHDIPAFVTFDAMRCQRAARGLALGQGRFREAGDEINGHSFEIQ
jgi:hypothetical protein